MDYIRSGHSREEQLKVQIMISKRNRLPIQEHNLINTNILIQYWAMNEVNTSTKQSDT